ncbi:MAG: hypothetical protein OEZ20_01275 [candidate division WOR-3 bacterium]|nr:hypothetical protein [candidate division WOR-3 bacterium]
MTKSLVITKLIWGNFMFIFTKEMADILLRIRVKANLTQREVASRDKRLTKEDLEENLGRF